jgi:DNA primase
MSRNEELQEALETIDMESWLDREGVKYKVTRGSRGTQLNIKECPCCGGSNWKVYLNAETGLGNCFSGDCEVKFNKWKFIQAHLGTATTRQVIEHVKEVAAEQGWQPRIRHTAAVQHDAELHLPESYELPIGEKNLKYLENRGITGEIARYFRLRFSKRGVFEYLDDYGRKMRQSYADRILIPIYDLDGTFVSFQGRDITGTADKKYLFPPGFASTGSYLYNGQNAIGAKRIVVGEGAFDVMALKIALDGDSALRDVVPVGSFGKHLSEGSENSQLSKLIKLKEHGLREVTFMWDGEKKATQDAVKAALMVRGAGLVARIAFLPKDKDPNEVAPEVVRQAFWKAEVLSPTTAAKIKLLCMGR